MGIEGEEERAVGVQGHGMADGGDNCPGVGRILSVVGIGFRIREEVLIAC